MPFQPVQVVPSAQYPTWGKIVMSWATGMDFLNGAGTTAFGSLLPGPDPAFKDDSVVKMSKAQFETRLSVITGDVTVQFPGPADLEIVFVRDTPNRRYVRLPVAAWSRPRTSNSLPTPRTMICRSSILDPPVNEHNPKAAVIPAFTRQAAYPSGTRRRLQHRQLRLIAYQS